MVYHSWKGCVTNRKASTYHVNINRKKEKNRKHGSQNSFFHPMPYPDNEYQHKPLLYQGNQFKSLNIC
jgi:hypothetical protein